MLYARGRVYSTFSNDGKFSIMVEISDNDAEYLISKAGLNTEIDCPVKTSDDGTKLVKAHTQFSFPVYLDGVEQNPDDEAAIKAEEIGADSEVEIAFKVVEGKYKGKKYQSAYLKGIDISKLVPAVPYNPFNRKNSV